MSQENSSHKAKALRLLEVSLFFETFEIHMRKHFASAELPGALVEDWLTRTLVMLREQAPTIYEGAFTEDELDELIGMYDLPIMQRMNTLRPLLQARLESCLTEVQL